VEGQRGVASRERMGRGEGRRRKGVVTEGGGKREDQKGKV